MKPKAKIINPQFVTCYDGGEVAIGRIIDHPRQTDFHTDCQRTSRILQKFEDGSFETKNTIYEVVVE